MSLNKIVSKIYCDGGARGNPGPAAIGFLAQDQFGHPLGKFHATIGTATNNTAEYEAVLAALKWLKHHPELISPQTPILFVLDSRLVANQLQGNFKIRQPHLRKLAAEAASLKNTLPTPITYTTVPRSQNAEADALVNQALDE